MQIRKCKNKKCQRPLTEGYKHKYCEYCRNEQVKRIKDAGKAVIGLAVFVGGIVITVVTNGKNNHNK